MAEGSYEAACMRAELLGLEKPNENDFIKVRSYVEKQNIEAAQFEEISLQNDDLNKTSGGLTELNSILSGTQRRLNKLKGVCGSLTDLIKNKMGGSKGDLSYSSHPSYIPNTQEGPSSSPSPGRGHINDALDDLQRMEENQNRGLGKDKNQQLSSQVDKLDALLMSADKAQNSLDSQNKQMKRYLK